MEIALFIVFVLAVYFIPTIIAASRNHHNIGSIFVVNMLLGWTFIGWVVAVAWSVSHVEADR